MLDKYLYNGAALMATALTAPKVKTLKTPGMYRDGEVKGLYLLVRDPAKKYWIFRYMKNGKAHAMGLGPACGRTPITLAQARGKADAQRKVLNDDRDPMVEKRVAKLTVPKTFDECAAEYIEAHGSKWSNNRNSAYQEQWEVTHRKYVSKHFGKLPVGEVNKQMVLKVLKPIWEDKRATARKIQNRLERILDYAISHEYRQGPNPARWRENLKLLLPNHSTSETRHHAAMPYAEVPNFARALKADTSMASHALQFLILTAARSGEVRGATFDEIDLQAKVWTIPASRMKAGKEHQVPLSTQAVAIVEAMQAIRCGDLVFPGARGKQLFDVSLSRVLKQYDKAVTVHGMRSAFRDWCGEETTAPREIAEAALAHAIGNQTEQAYRRGGALEKRRPLMVSWGEFCDRPERPDNVLSFPGVA
jgi:integrase